MSDSGAQLAESEAGALRREPIRVLHVDDEPDFADLVARFLQRQADRFEVTTRTDAREASAYLDDYRVDCVVSDYDMPGLNGIEFLETVRADRPDLPFILYTGKGSEEVASEAISAGVTDYLQKASGSSQYDVLANRIENAVETHRAQYELQRQNRAFGAFLDIVNDSTLAFEERLQGVLDLGVEFLNLDNGIISDIDPPEYTVEHVVSSDGSIEQGAVLDFSDTFCELVYESDGPVAFRSPEAGDVEDHPCYRDLGLEAYLGEPLIVDGEPYGTLNFSSPSARAKPFTDGERAFIRTMSKWVTMELSRRRRDREHPLERLHAATREMMDATSAEAVVTTASETAEAVLDLPMHGVHLHEPEEEALVPVAWTEPGEQVLDGPPPAIPVEGSLAGRAYRTGEPAVYPDVRAVDVALNADTPFRSELILPLGEHGVLVAGSRTPDDFDATDTTLARVLAANVESALDRVGREEDLARQRSLLAAQQEAVLDGMLVVDEDRRILSYNDRYLELWGVPEEIVERGDDEPAIEAAIDRVADPEAFRERVSYLYDHPEESAQDEIRLQGGRVLDRYTTPLIGDDGTHYGRLWTFRDITDREERIRQLERERNRFEAVFETVPDPTVHVVFEGAEPVIQHVNDAFEAVFGYGPEEARGQSVDELIVSGDQQAEAAEINDAVREAGRLQREIRRETVTGERPFLFTAQTMQLGDADGERVEGVGTYVDLTEQKRRENELARQNERLDEFASVLSHDLRNPLNVASGRLELAQETCDSDHLHAIAGALDRMEALIEDTLTLAREGDRVSDLEAVPLAELARDCWRTVETAEATLVAETGREVPADRSRLQQLLENLFHNAVEHGGSDVEIRIGPLDDDAGFYVADDGPGIPRDKRREVFEPRYSTADTGTGFGLSIVKQIAEAHGWSIRLTEAATGGARFEFTEIEPAG